MHFVDKVLMDTVLSTNATMPSPSKEGTVIQWGNYDYEWEKSASLMIGYC
jgi:hypothetical protein